MPFNIASRLPIDGPEPYSPPTSPSEWPVINLRVSTSVMSISRVRSMRCVENYAGLSGGERILYVHMASVHLMLLPLIYLPCRYGG